MADWSLPTLTSTYTNFLAEVKNRDVDLALQFDGTTSTNLTTGTVRWDSSANRWKKWTGAAWGELAATYALTGLSTTGAASIGTTLGVTGVATLSGGGTSTTPATDNNTTNIATTAFVVGQASATAPLMAGTATVGTSLRYARQDHRHPTDTTRAPLASPTFTGTVTIPAGASITGYAPLASPAFTGTPTSVTPATADNDTSIATTAFVKAQGYSPLASPSFTGTPLAPTAAAGTNTTQIATTAFVTGNTLQLSGGTMTGVINFATAQPRLVSGTSVASTSGVAIDFTGIPSWAKRVTVMFAGVSTSGVSAALLRFGAGTVQTTGYASTTSAVSASSAGSESLDTSGFKFGGSITATAIRHGTITATLIGSNIWSVFGIIGQSDVQYTSIIGGSVTLSGTLDRVRITTVNGTDTFDAGSINLLYEG